MKKTTLLMALTAMVIVMSGCSTVTRRTTVISNSSDYSINVAQPLIEPKLEVNKKVTGEAELTYLFCFIPLDEPTRLTGASLGWIFSPFERSARNAATYDAFQKSKADVLVAPYYTVKWNCYLLWSTYSAKVTGYAGTYKSFKQIPLKEQQELGILNKDGINVNANIEVVPKVQ